MTGAELLHPIHAKINKNTVRERQWWTASGVSTILCSGGCLADSITIAGVGFATFFMAGVIAIAHRRGNDQLIGELEKSRN